MLINALILNFVKKSMKIVAKIRIAYLLLNFKVIHYILIIYR